MSDKLRNIKGEFDGICDKAERDCSDLQRFPGYFKVKNLEALLVIEKSGLNDNGPLLEIGCGTGFQSSLLAAYCSKVIATDLPDFSRLTHTIGIKNAREMASRLGIGNLDYLGCSAAKLPFKDRTFGSVFASSVLEHVEDKVAALTEIKRVLKEDGLLLCTIPTYMESLFQFPSLYLYMVKRTIDTVKERLFGKKANHGSIFFSGNKEGVNPKARSSDLLKAFFRNNPSFPFPEPHGDWRNRRGKQSIFVEFYQQLPWRWNKVFADSGLKVEKSFAVLFIPYRIVEIFSPRLLAKIYCGTQSLHRNLAESFLKYFSISLCYVARKEGGAAPRKE